MSILRPKKTNFSGWHVPNMTIAKKHFCKYFVAKLSHLMSPKLTIAKARKPKYSKDWWKKSLLSQLKILLQGMQALASNLSCKTYFWIVYPFKLWSLISLKLTLPKAKNSEYFQALKKNFFDAVKDMRFNLNYTFYIW